MTHDNIDPNIDTNFIPKNDTNEDYIENFNNVNDLKNKKNIQIMNKFRFEKLYNEKKIPLIIAIVYAIFQMTYFKKSLHKFLPILFNKDSNLNFKGIAFNSVIFALICYILNKSINIIANIN